MKELKDIELKKGDIIYFDNGDIMPVDGWAGTIVSSLDYRGRITKIERLVKYETIYEVLLTKEEKEYLEAVCRPFKKNIVCIVKGGVLDSEWISVEYQVKGTIFDFTLPHFDKGKHYKKLELYKEYTLKELGLFE